MDRDVATALVDQLCRALPRGDDPAADDFDYGWFRKRVSAVAEQCERDDATVVWQYVLWHLDAEGLLPDGIVPRHEA